MAFEAADRHAYIGGAITFPPTFPELAQVSNDPTNTFLHVEEEQHNFTMRRVIKVTPELVAFVPENVRVDDAKNWLRVNEGQWWKNGHWLNGTELNDIIGVAQGRQSGAAPIVRVAGPPVVPLYTIVYVPGEIFIRNEVIFGGTARESSTYHPPPQWYPIAGCCNPKP